MQQQGKPTIRTIDQALADVRRGESRSRRLAQQDAGQKYRDASAEIQRRYQHDRAALLAEYTWTCPHCGNILEPKVYEIPGIPALGKHDKAIPAKVTVHRRQRCGCPAEAAVLAAQDEDENAAVDALQRRIALSNAGLEGWLASATFDTYDVETDHQQKQRRYALEYCTALLGGTLGTQPWLVLYGGYGLGKTHLAAAIVHAALDAGWDRCYLKVWSHWLEHLQSSWRDREVSTAVLLNQMQSGRLVVIDDVDKESNPTQWTRKELFTSLNERYNKGLPTILTGNRSPGAMGPWLGNAVSDRIIGIQFNTVEFQGQSYRSGLSLPVDKTEQERKTPRIP